MWNYSLVYGGEGGGNLLLDYLDPFKDKIMLNVRLFFFLSQCFYCRQTCQTISFILT